MAAAAAGSAPTADILLRDIRARAREEALEHAQERVIRRLAGGNQELIDCIKKCIDDAAEYKVEPGFEPVGSKEGIVTPPGVGG
jgi:hypothetical protein